MVDGSRCQRVKIVKTKGAITTAKTPKRQYQRNPYQSDRGHTSHIRSAYCQTRARNQNSNLKSRRIVAVGPPDTDTP